MLQSSKVRKRNESLHWAGCGESRPPTHTTHRLQPLLLQQPLQLMLRQLRRQHGSPLPPPLSILRLLGLCHAVHRVAVMPTQSLTVCTADGMQACALRLHM